LPRLRQETPPDASLGRARELTGTDELEILVPAVLRQATDRERLRRPDFADLTQEEAADARVMLESLRPQLPLRPARRRRVGPHGHRLASRRVLRPALARGGGRAWGG